MAQPPFQFSWLEARGVPFRRFAAGERVFLEHEAGESMFVVRSGRIDVITFGNVLETVGPGGILGEMALIDGGQRSAAALAGEATEAAVIDKETFQALVREEPAFALHVMHTLVARLRRMGRAH